VEAAAEAGEIEIRDLAVADARIKVESTLYSAQPVRDRLFRSRLICPSEAAFATVSRELGQALTGAAISGKALCEGRPRRANHGTGEPNSVILNRLIILGQAEVRRNADRS
jgi:hypothetical protein